MMFKYMCLVLFITWYQLAECHPASSNVKSLDSMIEKESEAFLSVEAEDSSHKNVRDKRTIGFLRQLFPNLSQIVDRKIQQITRFVFRVIGRLVLRGGGGAGAGAGGTVAGTGTGGESGSNGGRRISITLPTFPPSTDDEDEDAATVLPTADTSSSPASPSSDADAFASRIAEPASSEVTATDSAPAASVDSAAPADSAVAADSASEVAVTTADPATTSAPVTTTAAKAAPVTSAAPAAGSVSTTTVAAAAAAAATATASAISSPTTQMPLDSDNTVGTGIVKRTAREVSTNEPSSTKKRSPLTDTDNDVSSDNALSSNAGDDAQAETVADEDPRNKRFLFNLRGGAGGGSGNFLFDLIRLVAGSGANQDRDESSDSVPAEGEAQEVHAEVNAKEDGYSVGVPGPLTRIFVIANRGVANLVQDLILRLAQTTERIVNFKARLITSLI
ncbi:glycine, alanine and asparagine-rich protein-like isoform X3 [Myzus persicae]|uniref:glycine, alanine and asparagine-rich protein-like isoform X3 n=1 Tax=Myzus persicae TaxID=13164 RepID=UPI000B9344B3|nr:glycine, alanine and asparagine-rich protein-like isoform X3 [Myzus persicae]